MNEENNSNVARAKRKSLYHLIDDCDQYAPSAETLGLYIWLETQAQYASTKILRYLDEKDAFINNLRCRKNAGMKRQITAVKKQAEALRRAENERENGCFKDEQIIKKTRNDLVNLIAACTACSITLDPRFQKVVEHYATKLPAEALMAYWDTDPIILSLHQSCGQRAA